jgi:hypothetical protein
LWLIFVLKIDNFVKIVFSLQVIHPFLMKSSLLPVLALLTGSSLVSPAALVWTVGVDGDGWPVDGVGGGPAADFLQENGVINALPGNPITIGTASQASDNDYYFAGNYSSALPGVTALYGAYAPVGVVPVDETAWERAYAGGDLDLRVHFNVPASYGVNDLVTISFSAENLHQDATAPNPRFGIQLWMNGVMVRGEELIEPGDLGVTYTSAPVTLGSLGVTPGAPHDNVVSLRGISYNAAGGGNWMGIDYVSLDITPIPEPGSLMLLGGVLAVIGLGRRRI